jgi:Tfp pilus assembly protein PilV
MRRSPAERGLGTLEILVALTLFSVAMLGVGGMFMLSLSSGAAAETASIAMNLARARLETLRTIPAAMLLAENDSTSIAQVPPGQGRSYTIHTTVRRTVAGFLDITVAASWQVAYGGGCASGNASANCSGRLVMQTRTLETRVRGPDAP